MGRWHALAGIGLAFVLTAGAIAPAAPATAAVASKTAVALSAKTRVTSAPKSSPALLVGSTAQFRVKAVGSKLRYQWQVKSPKGSTYRNVAGARSATLTLKKVSLGQNKSRYRVVVQGVRGKVTSASAALNVRKAYKPVITALSASAFEVDRPHTLTVTGRNLQDVSKVRVAGANVKFTKLSSTKLRVSVPSHWFEKTTSLQVSSAAGTVSKPITYFEYLSRALRVDLLHSIDDDTRDYGAPVSKVKRVYDRARAYIASPKAWVSKSLDQRDIARYALEYSQASREEPKANAEYEKYTELADLSVKFGDHDRAKQYRAEATTKKAERDAWRQIQASSLHYIKLLGGVL